MPMEMNGPAGGGGPRRRQHHHHPHHHQQYMPQYHQQANPMYQNYGQQHNPYAPQQQYFGMPPQIQNGGMPSPGYPPYQGYARSPPAMPQYVPMVGVSVPPSFSRHVQSSPSLSTPYQPPQPAAPPAPPAPQAPPHTPASSHSSQIQAPVLTPPTPQTNETITPPSVAQEHSAPPPSPPPVVERAPFRPPLPWHSCPAVEFPARTSPRRKSRQRQRDDQNTEAVLLPKDQQGTATASPAVEEGESATPETAKQAQAADKIEETAAAPVQSSESENPTTEPTEPAPVVRAPPTSWAKLFAKTPVAAVVSINGENGTSDHTNGVAQDGPTAASSVLKANANSIAEAILSYKVGEAQQTSVFLEPRGLINTGNMCYMNSVLQVLMYCSPFYDFLAQISKRAAHSFNSETPLLDAMIMFMHEYKVLKSAPSNEQLRKVIRGDEIERYGEPFTPEFVYEAIRQLSRFASMRRGHQQDAEEFLGFLLQSLDDECTLVMNNASQTSSQTARSEAGSVDGSVDPSGDWLEVGRKRRAAVTRSWGSSTSTPITKIFGGLLRSEFRVPGLKDSITTEPYQPLQLDIGSPEVRNVVDALRGLTRPERLQGDFNSPRGKDITATKQVFIETLPPVLILHLKRFQFDAEGGTTKIWKNVGYPLDLEIPREVLARQARQTLSNGALPKYKLISVIYHHGKNASGGHYTADVRRQDGHEWLRLDDTVLRRLHSEQVAGGDSEEDTKDARKQNSQSGTSNRFGAMNDEDEGNDEGWNQVTASTGSNGKRWSSVVTAPTNGTSKDKYVKENIKDNKVAYILFYQRV
ncbi:Peptidase C19, ubiquitin carboxyl-terminal hydrolase 2 [Cordyceps fumosorosea ARSEF 2679]|uniref:Ubiquitin carboxyl-terminal hydrolase n=1 Tax=Cordyceps fumosorosea (strain ARSEF 2679) TaxID=1081104 RepID=A0A167LHI0_CORFA|nr:Peptidase C19, ubiquitin carboxyl-terminal hydrolase 2 [Cordyceps fumosorosea ARSEF 2679]OAA53099.1 Peptidase C19, ubiquitin carboxyl-terminal hydrolase 2 [Cordyceps fumosorosea ARSEF 2679]